MPNQATYADPRMDLGEAVAEYDFEQAGYIADLVLPNLGVPREAASFSKVTREGMLRREEVKRAKRGTYSRGEFDTEDDSYQCFEYGHEIPLDDSERALYANDFDAEFEATRIGMNRIMREREIRTAAAVFDTATWTGAALTTAVGTEWDDASADPQGDIDAAKEKVRSATGMIPNTLIISHKVLMALKGNTLLIDAVKYTARADSATILAAMADYLGVDRILAGKSVYNSAFEGQAYSGTDVWDDEYAMVAVIPPGGSNIRAPGIGRTMVWTQDTPETNGIVVEEYREEQTRSWVYRTRQNIDEKIIMPEMGHLLSNIHT